MGIFFSLLYIFTAYLAPVTIFGELAQYHIELIVAVVCLVFSLMNLSGSGLSETPQSYAVLGLLLSVTLSLAFNGVLGSAPATLFGVLSECITFLFILANFRTRSHIQLLIAVILLAALYTVYQGASAVRAGDTNSPWVFMMGAPDGVRFFRVRGMGFLNDPNDLCQFLVGLIPCIFIFWRSGNYLRNIVFVLVPVSALLYGMFLTHSRGGMLGLLFAVIVLGRRKFGILPAVVTGFLLYLAFSAIGWSGGREINAESGADRMEAWSMGLTLIRTHPLFGVGYQRFTEFFYITAHNTVVVCAAELGLIGFFFWTTMVVSTLYQLAKAAEPSRTLALDEQASSKAAQAEKFWQTQNSLVRVARAVAKPQEVARPVNSATRAVAEVAQQRVPRGIEATNRNVTSDEEIRRMCGMMMISLSGFLAAGWFLSRSYTVVVYVNIGMAVAVHRMALERGLVSDRLTLRKAGKYGAIASIALIALVYIILRLSNLLPK